MALAIPDSIREAIGDKASIDLINWANKSFEHNLDLRFDLFEARFNKKMLDLRDELKTHTNSMMWKLLGVMTGLITTQTALILGLIYFLHK